MMKGGAIKPTKKNAAGKQASRKTIVHTRFFPAFAPNVRFGSLSAVSPKPYENSSNPRYPAPPIQNANSRPLGGDPLLPEATNPAKPHQNSATKQPPNSEAKIGGVNFMSVNE